MWIPANSKVRTILILGCHDIGLVLNLSALAPMNTLIEANLSCLEQGISMLENLSPDIYSRKCEDVFGSSIGGHFRHNIDHYTALMDGYGDSRIDYDERERCTGMEMDSSESLKTLEKLTKFLKSLEDEDLDKPLLIRMDDGMESPWSRTSLRRELQFLLSHTIHHYALIVSIAARFGVKDFPEGFGVAPSTLHYRMTPGT